MPFSSTHEDNVSQKNKGQDGETFLIQRLLGFTQNRAIEVCGPLLNCMARLLSWFQNGDLHSQVQDWCFKKQFRVLPFGISKLTEKLVFMYSSLMTELKKEIARYFSEQNSRLHSKVYTTSLERKETDSSDFERSRVCFTQPN